MEPNPWKKHAGTLVGGGLGLALLSWILSGPFETEGTVGMVAGAVAILSGLTILREEVADWLRVYWLVGVCAAVVVLAMALPGDWVARLTAGGKLHPWIVRFLIVVFAQGIALAVWSGTRPKESFQAKRAGVAANVTILVEVAVALLILANWIGSNHLTRWIGSYDATEMKVYSLGERTERLLDSLADLPSPVHAVYLDFGSSFQSYGGPALGTRGKDFLLKYADASPNVIVREVDAVRNMKDATDYLRGLGVNDPKFGDEDTVVFLYQRPDEAEPNRKDVPIRSYEFLTTSSLGTPKFKGEEIYTSAIQSVVLPKKKVYVLKGHGEHPLTGSEGGSLKEAADLIRTLSLSVEPLNLAGARAVPADADLLWIAGPEAPLLPVERDAIVDWLDRGGSLLLMVDPQADLQNRGAEKRDLGLEEYLAKLGLSVKTDYLLVDYEVTGRTQANVAKTFNILTSDYSFHKTVSDLSERGFPSLFPQASPVFVEVPEGAEGVTAEETVYVRRFPPDFPPLTTYAAKLFPGRPLFSELDSDLTGQRLCLAAVAERKTPGAEGKDPVTTRVALFGDSDFATKSGLTSRSILYASGNPTLLTNTVSWLVGREELISIEPKTLESETVDLTERHKKVAESVALYALPVFVLLFAIGTAWRRRR